MRKLLILLVSIMLLGGLTACAKDKELKVDSVTTSDQESSDETPSEQSSETEKKTIGKVESKSKNGDEKNDDPDEKNTKEADSEDEKDKKDEKSEEDEGEAEEFNEEVIDTKQFKAKLIRAERVSDEFQKGERIEVTFEVENKRKDTVTVRGEEVSVDGKMVDDMMVYMMQDVSGGKKADIVLTIDDNYGKEKLPEMEENLEFILKVYSKENIESLDEHVVKIDFK
ncbi:MAG TPA: hypothetical protein VK119_05390 [Bacillota bacterium]|nr:hypothetical protein [Bacillota bacterium]